MCKYGFSGPFFNVWKCIEILKKLRKFTDIHLFLRNESEKIIFIIKINQGHRILRALFIWNVLRHVSENKLWSTDL
jgi:hypothetical protein